MKPFLLLVFLSLQSVLFAQITFEEIPVPKDFNLSAIRQSPTGEYFVQAGNDKTSIYSSLNGQDWTRSTLPESHTMNVIQFFPDGTPVLKDDSNEHLIRRNGSWSTMKLAGSNGYVQASFIKGDTLFVYQDNSFAYSMNKGQTFTKMFTYSESIIDHSANLWKFDNYFVLHHTAGASDYLSVFTNGGERIRFYSLGVSIPEFNYTTCGQVLITDNDSYYLFKEEGLILESGPIADLFPGLNSGGDFLSQDDHFYMKTGKEVYRSMNCEFSWELVASNDLIHSLNYLWINQQGDIFLYDLRDDSFVEQASGSNVWGEYPVNIDYAQIINVDESIRDHQIVLTSNALFRKKIAEPGWTELDTSSSYTFDVQYSPDGDLYVNRKTDILYSSDNGNSFSTISLPPEQFPFNSFYMKVLDDDILFLISEHFGEGYYTINNGLDWIPVFMSFPIDIPLIKLVDDYILVAQLNYQYVVTRINIATNISTSVDLGDFYTIDYSGSVIQDDGTIYFQARDFSGSNPEGLYRYRIGEGLEFLGQFQALSYLSSFETAGTDVYAFSNGEYYVFNGETVQEYPLSGLPYTAATRFIVSNNHYVYALLGSHRLFRSTEPLFYPQYISGHVYDDATEDCAPDTTDAGLEHWQVKIESDSYLRIKSTDSEGRFSFSVPQGEYSLSSQPINANWDLCKTSYNLSVDETSPTIHQDFSALVLRHCADLTFDFSTPRLRRCFDNYYSVRVRNTGPEASDGTILTFKLDPFFDFTSATIPYTLVGDSIVKFDLGILEVNDEITFSIFFKLSCDAEPGMEHCLTGFLTDDNLCGGERSMYTECQENIGSYDPNDKRVFNEAGDETERIDKGEYIYYHIRFQNTGTDTAFNIRVVDPLSPKLDLSTLEMLSASQSYEYFISDGPALVVLFDDVLLPDSTTNEPASHGFFKFRVKPLPEFDYGTSIPNQANIYFDFNEPVLTNEATMFILPPVSTKEIKDLLEFNVFPNPATNVLTISFAENDGSLIDAYEIVDHLGRRITKSSFSNSNVISVAHLVPGIYNLMLKEKGSVIGMKKFVRL